MIILLYVVCSKIIIIYLFKFYDIMLIFMNLNILLFYILILLGGGGLFIIIIII